MIGGAIVVVGIVLLPLPGPGWLIIFAGLGLLASEFAWARRLLRFARRQVEAWSRWLRRQLIVVRLVVGAAALLAVAGAAVGYVAWRGLPAWWPSWLPDLGLLGIG